MVFEGKAGRGKELIRDGMAMESQVCHDDVLLEIHCVKNNAA
jgi:hypothetical protein